MAPRAVSDPRLPVQIRNNVEPSLTVSEDGVKKLIIADLRPSAVFGEMACVGQHLYHCSAEATKASRIRYLSRAIMETVLKECPEVSRRLLDLVGRRFVQVLLNLEETSFQPLIPRLAKLLLNDAEENSVRDVTHREIAERLHAYGESVTSALGELRKAGIIAIGRKMHSKRGSSPLGTRVPRIATREKVSTVFSSPTQAGFLAFLKQSAK